MREKEVLNFFTICKGIKPQVVEESPHKVYTNSISGLYQLYTNSMVTPKQLLSDSHASPKMLLPNSHVPPTLGMGATWERQGMELGAVERLIVRD